MDHLKLICPFNMVIFQSKLLVYQRVFYGSCSWDSPTWCDLRLWPKIEYAITKKLPVEFIWIKLDEGWPESVEEQGLLLLVWRHNITNNIWKMCYRQSRRGVARQNSEKCKTIVCIANTFTHRRFYTQKLLHRSFYTQKLLHRGYYTQSFYPQKLLHTDAFTHRCFYTQTLLHGHCYTQTRLHTDTFTHRPFYTQALLLDTNALTHRSFYT